MIISGSKILIKAAFVKDTWVPIWEFTHSESEDYGDVYTHKNSYRSTYEEHFKDVYYDINSKTIDMGITVDIYPKNVPHNVGDTVYISLGSGKIQKRVISDVIFSPEKNEIISGSQAIREYGNLTNVVFDPATLYNLILYKEKYKVVGSSTIFWPYQVLKLEE